MFNKRNIGLLIVLFLVIGAVIAVFLVSQTTQTKQTASGVKNINTTSQVSKTNNADKTMGPKTSSENYSNLQPADKTGTLTFFVTDLSNKIFPTGIPSITPTNNPEKLSSLIIKIKKAEVHLVKVQNSNSDYWETLDMPLPVSVDLLKLKGGDLASLGQTRLALGNYSEIRLYIDSAKALLGNGNEEVLVKISDNNFIVRVMQDFTIDKGKNTSIIMDFDGEKSVVENKIGLELKPVVLNLFVNK